MRRPSDLKVRSGHRDVLGRMGLVSGLKGLLDRRDVLDQELVTW